MSCTKSIDSFNSLIQLSNYLSSEEKCMQFIEDWRWKGDIHCPHCGMDKVYRFKTRRIFKCSSCKHQFSAKSGTIFEKSLVPTKKWILAIYLVGANKRGITGLQLAKEIEVSNKTGWLLLHKIRKMMQPEYKEKLSGVIMSDETFVGGKNKNRHLGKKIKNNKGRSFVDKTPVMGLMQVSGEVRCIVVPDTSNSSIHPVLKEHIEEKSILVTDEWMGYKGLRTKFNHQVVQHRLMQYKSKDGYTTNGVEGFWGSLKRTIIGGYNWISRKHMQKYADEIAFRFNTRTLDQSERFALMMGNLNRKLTYKQLVYGN